MAGVLMFQNEVTNRRDDCCKVGRSSAKYYKVAIHEKHNWMCVKFLFYSLLFCFVFLVQKNQESGGMGSLRPGGVCWCDLLSETQLCPV